MGSPSDKENPERFEDQKDPNLRILGVKLYYGLRNTLQNNQINEDCRKIHIHFIYSSLGVILGVILAAPSRFAGRWLFGDFLCQFYAFEGFVFGISNINILVAIVLERYYSTKKVQLPWNSTHILYVCWIVGLFWSLLPLFGFGSYALELHQTSCTIKIFDLSHNHQLYMWGLIIVGFLLPVSIGIIFHFLTLSMESEKSEKINQFEKTMNNISRKLFLADLFSWCGYLVLCLIGLFSNQDSHWAIIFSSVSPLLTKFGIAILPMLYRSVKK